MSSDLLLVYAIVAAVCLLIVPRLWTFGKSAVASVLSKPTTTVDVHSKVDAYRALAGDLPVDLAAKVWACIQWPLPPEGPQSTEEAK